MSIRQLFLFTAILGLCGLGNTASGQLFGKRAVGPGGGPAAEAGAGIITGLERFIRGNRSPDNFVGAGNATSSVFSGGTQAAAVTSAASSVDGLAEEAVPPVNVPRRRKSAGIYLERLTVDFQTRPDDYVKPPRPVVSQRLSDVAYNNGFSVTLSPEGSQATMYGTVQSQHQKQIAELLVLFEPGIETVTNELRVEPTSSR